ncbi:helix-turn-helix transcriptional regulator [Kitasatospora putterlickiae]|uniref:Helix-turn-helix transcriptional regulator n=1 Tax=Kitasatospora putterlickiae TaxID=221725 RepID=A0ABN1XTE4_9ACTN
MAHRRIKRGPTASSAVMFGEELRFYREMAGYTQEELAKLLHCDRTVLTRCESGKRRMQPEMVEDADRLLDTGGSLKRLWDRVDWNAEIEHPDWFQDHAEMEAEAVALRLVQCSVVHGLLQCPAYARAVFEAGDEANNPALIEERTAARLGRQKRFLDPDGPLLVAILDESVIRTAIGGPGVMRRQMDHLLSVARLPNIVIQIVPFGHRRMVIDKSMVLLEMPDGQHWVYSESLDRGHPSNVPSIVSGHQRRYDRLRREVLSMDDSLLLIAKALEGFKDEEERARRSRLAQEQLQRQQRGRLCRGGPRVAYPRRRSGA